MAERVANLRADLILKAMNRRTPAELNSVTLAVCTFRRPALFEKFVRSVDGLVVPAGIRFQLVVADNNAESHYELYIRDLLEGLRFKSLYGHEPEAGYANARNKALQLALQTDAELLAFLDDDMALDPNWLLGHLRSYQEFACDVVGGAIMGGQSRHKHGRRFAHGEERPMIGTCNVSFGRWIASEDGLGLRFDPRFNKTGGEDKAFFSEAHRQGAKIVVSVYPVVHHSSAPGRAPLEDLKNKAQVSSIMHRNAIARLRNERSFPAALMAALGGLRFGLKSLFGYVDYSVSGLLRASGRAERKKVSAYKNFQKMVQGFKGLSGDYVKRYEVRRSF